MDWKDLWTKVTFAPAKNEFTPAPGPLFKTIATLLHLVVSLAANVVVMKKKVLLSVVIMLLALVSFAQSYEGTIQYNKKKHTAIVCDYSYPAQAVENAFVKRMEQLGYKAKEEKGILNRDKGFLVFKNAYVTDISKDKMDYIIKVERKSRKESDESVIYMIMLKNDTNAIPSMEAYEIGKAKSYLNEMLPDIEAAHLELQIAAQEELVAKTEKKLKELREDKVVLEKKLAENASAQEETIKDIDAQKKRLEALKEKRKKN